MSATNETLYFITRVELPSGDFAQLFVPKTIDAESFVFLRATIDLQMEVIGRKLTEHISKIEPFRAEGSLPQRFARDDYEVSFP